MRQPAVVRDAGVEQHRAYQDEDAEFHAPEGSAPRAVAHGDTGQLFVSNDELVERERFAPTGILASSLTVRVSPR